MNLTASCADGKHFTQEQSTQHIGIPNHLESILSANSVLEFGNERVKEPDPVELKMQEIFCAWHCSLNASVGIGNVLGPEDATFSKKAPDHLWRQNRL